jgi:hypothetical protein
MAPIGDLVFPLHRPPLMTGFHIPGSRLLCVGPMKFGGERETDECTDECTYYAYAQWDMLVVLLLVIMGSVQVQIQSI